MRHRVHVGCGIENPFGARLLWGMLLLAWAIQVSLAFSWWGFLGYLPWLAVLAVGGPRGFVPSAAHVDPASAPCSSLAAACPPGKAPTASSRPRANRAAGWPPAGPPRAGARGGGRAP